MEARLKTLTLAALLAAPLLAHATDGYFQHGYGVKSQGAGGVGIAYSQDGLAGATNPAGTAFLEDRIDAGITWFSPQRETTITAPNPTAGQYNGNGKSNFYLPELGLIKRLSPDLALGLAIYGNGGMNTQYDKGLPLFGRGQAGVNLEQLFITPSISYKLNEQHSLGLALNYAYQRFSADGLQNFDNANFSTSPGNVTNKGSDSSSGWGVRLGWQGDVLPNLRLGLTWASKIHAGKFEKYKGLFADSGSFDIPASYGAGLAFKASDSLTLAADVERILYGDVASINNPLSNIGNGLGAAGGAGFGWQNVTVYKLGVIYQATPELTLRAGYNHSSQPIPASQTLFNILAPGVIQNHLSLGATYQTSGNGELSVAYTHGFRQKVSGSSSIPASFGGGEANIQLQENILGIAYGWKF